jgi:hypothetical protein
VLYKTAIALLVLAAVGLASGTEAIARGGHVGGGHFHHGGWYGGGFGWGLGYGPWGYPYDDGQPLFRGRGCYAVQQRVRTRYGWGIRRTSICE